MTRPRQPDHEFEHRIASRLLNVLIRAGLIGLLAALCYVVFAPFLTLMAWAVILAVSLYPCTDGSPATLGGVRASPRPCLLWPAPSSSSFRQRSC